MRAGACPPVVTRIDVNGGQPAFETHGLPLRWSNGGWKALAISAQPRDPNSLARVRRADSRCSQGKL
jgi:hypothetical protein